MKNEEILSRARQYVTYEEHADFREPVEKLIEAREFGELSDRFYTDLEFGTGGLRGVIGGGYNRVNPYIVRRATAGLARYVARFVSEQRGEDAVPRAVIAYDCRRYSATFAKEAALVLCSYGFQTFLFSDIRPTPVLSFAVRMLKADTGIVVTASHNPPDYNGYKVYWNDGSQVVAPHDHGIIETVNSVTGAVPALSEEEAASKGLLKMAGEEVDSEFVAMVKRQVIRADLFRDHAHNFSMVYTPLHGTGTALVERVLSDLGVPLHTVPEQREPDGEFPTVASPNPEEGAALEMAVEQAGERGAALVLGSDPDADRIGIAVPDTDNPGSGYRLVTGNQLGALLADYVLGSRAELGRLPAKPAFIKTIVTTELQRSVAEHHGATVFETLTGFKHIAALIRSFEAQKDSYEYVIGGEESYGYMIGTEVRDKDAVSAAVLTAEMALYHVSNGKSVIDRLNELYTRFGYYEEQTISRRFEGQDGVAAMKQLMERLRESPVQRFGEDRVVLMRDYLNRVTLDLSTGKRLENIELPVSDVLQFELSDGSRVSVRPSGTEPKIKFYASVHGAPGEPLREAMPAVKRRVTLILETISDLMKRDPTS